MVNKLGMYQQEIIILKLCFKLLNNSVDHYFLNHSAFRHHYHFNKNSDKLKKKKLNSKF